jgi:two-component system, NarL family, response regulator LiaR
MDAVRQAEILDPDLVLLDIALPGLNGIEVARRISKRAPACKIIFLSQNSSPAVAEEALRVGACGYVLKTDAAAEFFPAIETALAGGKYVSQGVRENSFPDTLSA